MASDIRVCTVHGDDILAVYNDRDVPSSLNGHESVNWYAQNPESVELVVAYQDFPVRKIVQGDTTLTIAAHQQLLARALLWKTQAGLIIVDRIYGCEEGRTAIKLFAFERGYAPAAVAEQVNACVVMNQPSGCGWPFLDTFRYGRFYSDNRVKLYTKRLKDNDDRVDFVLVSHEGFMVHPYSLNTEQNRGAERFER